MKRVLIRLSALSVVIALGLIAIAQAQKGPPAQTARPKKLTAATAAKAKPIPLPAAEEEPSMARNPFAQSSRSINSLRANPLPTPDDRYAADNAGAEASDAGDHQAAQAAVHHQSDQLSPGDRYAERTASAEEPVDSGPKFGRGSTKTAEEPRYLGADDEKRGSESARAAAADRYATQEASKPERPQHGEPADERPAPETPHANLNEPSVLGAADDSNFAPPAEAGTPNEGTGRPGAQQLEGKQAPSVAIEKKAPAEVQVGKPATFIVKVRNVGPVDAHDVEIRDEVPKGTQFINTNPASTRGPKGEIVWAVGTLRPGEEQQLEVQLMPVSEGEIGSVATASFRADASVRTVATRPQLALDVTAPTKVMIGETVAMKIKLSNPGSGAATKVVLTETVPQGFKHSGGHELEFEVGTLKPGESRQLELVLQATDAGRVTNVMSARAEPNVQTESRSELEVIAPALKVSLTGPKRRYLERTATHNISVSNPGTAAAKDIELVTVLPKGLKFVEANNAGQYDAATHSVYWSLEELPAQESGSVSLTTLPVEPGELKMQVRSQAKQGLKDQHEETVTVEGLAAILFELVDVQDPIEVNGQTTYEIRVINQGSKAASNVRLVALLPDELKPVSAEGPVRHVIDGQRVLFDSLKQLAPKADTTYTIKVQGLAAGDLRTRVQLMTDDLTSPITKEESTRVYADQ